MDVILIFAGGDLPDPGVVEELPAADLVVAADSGYDVALHLGYTVDLLVGDLDSIKASPIPESVKVSRHPRDKDQTDLDLAIELAMRESPERVVVVGGSGGRLDHEIATTGLLCSERWEASAEIDWISTRGRAHVLGRRRILHGDVGATVSLIPIGGAVGGVTTNGLQWELSGALLDAGSTWGVSNVMRQPFADIAIDSGCLLVVFPEGPG
jgi:thiamine pyrophosphokinase